MSTETGVGNKKYESDLKRLNKGYVLVAQIDSENSKPKRAIIFVFTPKDAGNSETTMSVVINDIPF